VARGQLTFVLWGLWHGGLLALERATGHDKRAAGRAWTLPLTLLCVLIGWVMFRAADVGQGGEVYAAMLGLNGWVGDPALWRDVTRESLFFAVLAAVVCTAEPWLWTMSERRNAVAVRPDGTAVLPMAQAVASLGLVVLAAFTVMKLAEQSHSPFLYFQF